MVTVRVATRANRNRITRRFVTLASQSRSTQRKPCNFADPNGSRRVCNLRPASLLFSVIAAIALFASLLFFPQVRILRALLARGPVFSLLFTGNTAWSGLKGAVSALHLNHRLRTLLGSFGKRANSVCLPGPRGCPGFALAQAAIPATRPLDSKLLNSQLKTALG
jgi:hypothetical protein